ncbi:MAG: hypothetical protein ABI369_16145 [Acetobacteraceae bacterium]
MSTEMPTTITLTTFPGTLEEGPGYVTRTIDLFGPSLGSERITVRRTDEVARAVERFGERIRTECPDASFTIHIRIAKGDRKPAGFDVAKKAGSLGQDAFMRTVENRAEAFATIAVPETAAPAQPVETVP